jgi:hypothetical protein
MSAFSTSAADSLDSVIGELRARERGEVHDPKFGQLTLHHGAAGMSSYWEGRYIWKADCSLVTMRIQVPPGAALPSAEQREFVEDLERRYSYFMASALVLLKPAFRHYIGEQVNLRTLLEEFLLTGVAIPSLGVWPYVHEFLYRCTTDPTKAFYVTYTDGWAKKIRVDESE